MNDFVKALSIADIAVITDIMGSREKNTDGVYAEQLEEKIPNAVWFKTDHELVDKQTAQQKEYNFSQCIDYIKKNCKEGDLVITLGCGYPSSMRSFMNSNTIFSFSVTFLIAPSFLLYQ